MGIKEILMQRGFNFEDSPTSLGNLELKNFLEYHKRVDFKRINYDSYPRIFEALVREIMIQEFGFDAISDVVFLDEGVGGDFDVLASNVSNEVTYLECKSGNNISLNELDNFYKRHLFLKPDLSILIFDQPKKNVREYLEMMRKVLTDYYKKQDPNLSAKLDYQYPGFETIPGTDREFAYHMNRNLFFCSGDNIVRAIAHCLRYYHGTVKQRSYYG